LCAEVLAEKSSSGTMLTVDLVKAAMNEKLGEKKEHLLTESEFNQVLKAAEADGHVQRRGRQLEVRA